MNKDKKPYRILVIEDNSGDFLLIEDFIHEQLERPEIIHRVNFVQAATWLQESAEVPDVILLDLTLPDKSGASLVDAILQTAGSVPVIILTGFADIEFSTRSIALGISDYLVKDELNAPMLYKSIVYSIERKRTYQQLQESEKRVIRAIIKTQEEERYEIGGELHDNVCQLLATSIMSLGMLRNTEHESYKSFYESTNNYINMAIEEIRNLSHRLAPVFFDDDTFEIAITSLVNSFNMAGKFDVLIDYDKKLSAKPMHRDLQLNLYRILQEQLRNISKYAQASRIMVSLQLKDAELELAISDNGIGFSPEKVRTGIGMANMKRRAELFGGNFFLDTAPGKGCTVRVRMREGALQ